LQCLSFFSNYSFWLPLGISNLQVTYSGATGILLC
jgi:hypothetical protein